ncbi:MAG: arginine repressor [Holophagaceae bacterium]|nr:arginine repressor [Holophagaceae bacterium]
MSRTLDEIILHIIEKHALSDQDALRAMLLKLGHDLTQPTLSRHLKKLNVLKVEGRYRRVEPAHATLPTFIISEAPPNLLVLRTEPGFANALAIKLDTLQIPGLAGTIAGDDTIFIAVQGQRFLSSVKAAVASALS